MTDIPLTTTDIVYQDGLTPQQSAYVHFRSLGLNASQSAKRAGYPENKRINLDLDRNPRIRAAIDRIREEARIRFDIDRDRVVEGIMEALSVAREQSDAKIMILAWTELARITGVQAPEVKKLEISGEVTAHHLAQVSDKQLLTLLGKERTLELPPLEGEYDEILPSDGRNAPEDVF